MQRDTAIELSEIDEEGAMISVNNPEYQNVMGAMYSMQIMSSVLNLK